MLALVLSLSILAAGIAMPGIAESALTYEKTNEAYTRNAQGYPQLNGITLTIWCTTRAEYADATDKLADMQVIQDFMKMLDVNLEFTHPALSQAGEYFALMVASDKLPDMIWNGAVDSSYPGGVSRAYGDGLLFDYTELVNEQNTPLFIEKVLNNKSRVVAKGAYDDNGRIIRLGSTVSGSDDIRTTMRGIMIREDMLEATGMAVPVTIDDWYAMLTAMKQNGVEYPLILDKDKYWQSMNAFSSAYDISASSHYVRQDGSVGYGPYEDVYYDYLSTLHKWYSEGLINPDFMNQDIQQTWSMIADDLGGATANHLQPYHPYYWVPVESVNPEKAMTAANYPVLKEGDPIRMMPTAIGLSSHKYITVDAKNPLACVLVMDAMYADEVNSMMVYAVPGVAHTINELGYPVLTPITPNMSNEELRKFYIHVFATELDTDLDYLLTSKYCYGAQPIAINLFRQNSYDGIYPSGVLFTEAESKVISNYKADIDTYREEMMLKFVTGNESLDHFGDYQAKLKAMHIEDLLEVYQSAYDRYQARQ